MNSYTFHINQYDLAFLGTLFTGLIFALQLIFTKRKNQTANRFLGLALLTIVLQLVWVLGIDIRLGTYFPNWNRLPLQFSLALGPLIYFYVLKMTRPENRFRRKDLLHFSPLLLQQGVLLLAARESLRTGAATYDTLVFHQLNPIIQFIVFISVITYLYLCHRLIERFYQGLKFNGGKRPVPLRVALAAARLCQRSPRKPGYTEEKETKHRPGGGLDGNHHRGLYPLYGPP